MMELWNMKMVRKPVFRAPYALRRVPFFYSTNSTFQ
jgi:hypothetical protein